MARPAGAPRLEWDERKQHWRLRFTSQKRRYDFSCSTIPKKAKAQAAYWAEARVTEVKSGKWAAQVVEGSDPNASMELIARAFLAERTGGLITEDWAKTQKLHLEKHILPTFKRLSDVNKGTLSTWQAKRLKSVRWETVKKERSTLLQLLTFAEEKGLIAEVPRFPKKPAKSLGTRHPKGRLGPTKTLTAEMVERLIVALPEFARKSRIDGLQWPLRSYFAIMYETSLRPTFWDRFRVGRHWSPGDKEIRITDDADKNRWARTVPLTKLAQKILESTPVQEDGRMFVARDFRASLRAAAERLKLPKEVQERVTAYDMRHQAITRFANSTGGVLGAAYLAGHKQVTTTNKYSHANQEHAAKTIASLSGSGGHSGGVKGEKRKRGKRR